MYPFSYLFYLKNNCHFNMLVPVHYAYGNMWYPWLPMLNLTFSPKFYIQYVIFPHKPDSQYDMWLLFHLHILMYQPRNNFHHI